MEDLRRPALEMTAALQERFGDAVQSVILYGSVPRGEAVPGVSDLNLLVVLDHLSGARLVEAVPMVQGWVRAGNTPPHLYSAQEWDGMQDTFAIELADMVDAREVLAGRDVVQETRVSPADLRLHAEQEVRETLLHLRLRLLLSGHDGREVGRLLMAGMPSFVSYMRAALRLSGQAPGLASENVIRLTAGMMGADPDPMLVCWEARKELRPFGMPLDDPFVDHYMDWIQGLVQFIDGLPPAPAATDAP